MSLLSLATNLRSSTSVYSDSWRRGRTDGTFFFGMGYGGSDLYVEKGNDWYLNAYKFCPPVASIINRKAEAYINGENFITTRSGKGKGKESQSEAAQKIRKLLSNPNPLQSRSQFEAQSDIYFQVYGYCLILPIKPVGFPKPEDTARFWIIPPSLVDIEESKKLWYTDDGKTIIKKIVLTLDDETAELNWDDLIFLKDFVPSLSSLIIPDSRLSPLRYPVETVIQAFQSMKNGLKNTPLGIIGNDTKDSMSFIPLESGEKERIEYELRSKGLGEGQSKFIVSNANLQWRPINYPIDTLQIPENIKTATAAICDSLGFPFELLSNDKGVTFSNKRDAMKILYQDFIIPMSKSIYEQLNEYFKTEDLNIIIEKDFSHMPILQEDALAKATARKMQNEALKIEFENDLITVNRWLELNFEDTRGTEGDVYYSQWIKTNPEILETKKGKQNV